VNAGVKKYLVTARIVLLAGLVGMFFAVVSLAEASHLAMQETADALLRNAQEMIAHGGMGDAKAIVHHCSETARYAEVLLTQVSESDLRRSQGAVPLEDVIRQCKRVLEIGIYADPGQLLNPAIKARASAREAITLLGWTRLTRNYAAGRFAVSRQAIFSALLSLTSSSPKRRVIPVTPPHNLPTASGGPPADTL
jgi:hypothetical protein